ncbi:MAG: hypothetical protein HY290_33170 [Planctomycetia bacterium]|nr:hypothetical protein [Planctomycetia bacterium]
MGRHRGLAIGAIWAFVLGGLFQRVLLAAEPPPRQPLFRVVDLNVDESQEVELADGSRANVTLLGVEEGAGYYAHLHFDIKSKKPSGKWGVEDAYAFLWDRRQHEAGLEADLHAGKITPATASGSEPEGRTESCVAHRFLVEIR